MKLKLSYFPFPFWRAEISRVALFMADIEFENHYVSFDELRAMKKDGSLPFGQVPILEVDGQVIAQTGAIARFCGKLGGLYPKDNDLEAALIDQFIDDPCLGRGKSSEKRPSHLDGLFIELCRLVNLRTFRRPARTSCSSLRPSGWTRRDWYRAEHRCLQVS